jgi:hypothetical protein
MCGCAKKKEEIIKVLSPNALINQLGAMSKQLGAVHRSQQVI